MASPPTPATWRTPVRKHRAFTFPRSSPRTFTDPPYPRETPFVVFCDRVADVRVGDTCVYFVRTTEGPVDPVDFPQQILCGEVGTWSCQSHTPTPPPTLVCPPLTLLVSDRVQLSSSVLSNLEMVLRHVFIPTFETRTTVGSLPAGEWVVSFLPPFFLFWCAQHVLTGHSPGRLWRSSPFSSLLLCLCFCVLHHVINLLSSHVVGAHAWYDVSACVLNIFILERKYAGIVCGRLVVSLAELHSRDPHLHTRPGRCVGGRQQEG